ncbi:MAG: hypothetical protein B6D41_07500 [Chloroflexi bacterium UTCFX4]|jgi:hypothetical protein|nr:MAG: hypothetical protein B6D41_07500 [Chloroflexi bacterium UTCFX4]
MSPKGIDSAKESLILALQLDHLAEKFEFRIAHIFAVQAKLVGLAKSKNRTVEVIQENAKIHRNNSAFHIACGVFKRSRNIIASRNTPAHVGSQSYRNLATHNNS